MNIELMDVIRSALALGAGGLIGFTFGVMQTAAARRNEKRQREGKPGGWGVGLCVIGLMLALVVIQMICPLLFSDHGTRWWVSAGVLCGYGIVLFRQLRQQLARNK